jgi:hypothetical protein
VQQRQFVAYQTLPNRRNLVVPLSAVSASKALHLRLIEEVFPIPLILSIGGWTPARHEEFLEFSRQCFMAHKDDEPRSEQDDRTYTVSSVRVEDFSDYSEDD